MNKRPVAYLRKSRITTDHHLSWEMQETAIKALAKRHGANGDLLILSDWGKSGRGAKVRFRKGYAELLHMVESDQVSALFGYSISRLARSLGDYVKLAELCRDHGVQIHLDKEGTLDYSTASGKLLVNLLASVAQAEADWGSERATDAMKVRQARGEYIGNPPFGYRVVNGQLERNPDEPVEAVLAAYRQAGTYNGAARILNDDMKVRPRDAGQSRRNGRAHSLWSMTGVRAVVQREAPQLVRRWVSQGTRGPTNALLARLVRCHCGQTLTPIRNDRGYTSYMCWHGYRDSSHKRPYMVSEGKLLPWVKDEAARFRPPRRVSRAAEDSSRAALEAQREQLGWALVNGVLKDRDAVMQKQAEIDAAIESLDAEREAVQVPAAVDWERWEASDINDYLRTIIDHVQLDEAMRPAQAEWRIPAEWLR